MAIRIKRDDAVKDSTKSMEEHDKQYHGGHFDPQHDTCSLRDNEDAISEVSSPKGTNTPLVDVKDCEGAARQIADAASESLFEDPEEREDYYESLKGDLEAVYVKGEADDGLRASIERLVENSLPEDSPFRRKLKGEAIKEEEDESNNIGGAISRLGYDAFLYDFDKKLQEVKRLAKQDESLADKAKDMEVIAAYKERVKQNKDDETLAKMQDSIKRELGEEIGGAIARQGINAFMGEFPLCIEIRKARRELKAHGNDAKMQTLLSAKVKDLETISKFRDNLQSLQLSGKDSDTLKREEREANQKWHDGMLTMDGATLASEISIEMYDMTSRQAREIVNSNMRAFPDDFDLIKTRGQLSETDYKETQKFLAATLPTIKLQCPGLGDSIKHLYYSSVKPSTYTEMGAILLHKDTSEDKIASLGLSFSYDRISRHAAVIRNTENPVDSHYCIGDNLSDTPVLAGRSILIHELGHSLLTFKDVYEKWSETYSQAKKVAPNWVESVSRYATINMDECHSEVIAKYTQPGYKKGSLPKLIEDYCADVLVNGNKGDELASWKDIWIAQHWR